MTTMQQLWRNWETSGDGDRPRMKSGEEDCVDGGSSMKAGEETCPWASDCGPVRKRRISHRCPTGYAPPLDSTLRLLPLAMRTARGAPAGQRAASRCGAACISGAGFRGPADADPGAE